MSRDALENSARRAFESLMEKNSEYDQSYLDFARKDPAHWRDRILAYLSEEYDKIYGVVFAALPKIEPTLSKPRDF